MDRIDKILNNKIFLKNLDLNNTAEAQRHFCRHNMVHFLDVARIATIISLEEGLELNREVIYAAGLLHDCGKHLQYSKGIPHEEASAQIAPQILEECSFTKAETDMIIGAILSHRDKSVENNKDLSGILYRADKASRACFCCEAFDECNWKNDKKNLKIKY